MMDRRGHIVGGTIVWGIVLFIYMFVGDINANKDAMWVIMSLIVVQAGAVLPDYDLLSKKFLPHRNVITHSFFLPALLTIPIYFVRDETNVLLPLFAFFLIGYSSHLLLDMKPKSWQGSARVHIFWRNEKGNKQMGSKRSFAWILVNGLILMAAGIILLYFFNKWMVI